MPLWTPPSAPQTFESSFAVGARDGTSVTASGTANTKGAYTELIASTVGDSYGVWVYLRGLQTSATNTSCLVDISLGAAASEVVLIPNVNAGAADIANRGMQFYFFPVFIPAGSRVAARCQAAVVSDVVTVGVTLEKQNPYPDVYSRVTDYGTVSASSRGTLVTAGAGAYGSFTSVGSTTARDHLAWTIGVDQGGDTTLAATGLLAEIGIGGVTVAGPFRWDQGATEQVQGVFPPIAVYAPVPSGTQMQVRVAASATSDIPGVILYAMD